MPIYLPHLTNGIDQRTQLTNKRFDTTYPQPFTDLGFLHLSSFFSMCIIFP
ncbi:hypothetical protein T03_5585, partial [Trichinella britovi]